MKWLDRIKLKLFRHSSSSSDDPLNRYWRERGHRPDIRAWCNMCLRAIEPLESVMQCCECEDFHLCPSCLVENARFLRGETGYSPDFPVSLRQPGQFPHPHALVPVPVTSRAQFDEFVSEKLHVGRALRRALQAAPALPLFGQRHWPPWLEPFSFPLNRVPAPSSQFRYICTGHVLKFSEALARSLNRLDLLSVGERVGVMLPTSALFFLVDFACQFRLLTLVPFHEALRSAHELAVHLSVGLPHAFVIWKPFVPLFEEAMRSLDQNNGSGGASSGRHPVPLKLVIVVDGDASGGGGGQPGQPGQPVAPLAGVPQTFHLVDLIEQGVARDGAELEAGAAGDGDVIADAGSESSLPSLASWIVFTSGSTGTPKGVVVSTRAWRASLNYHPPSVSVAFSSLAHSSSRRFIWSDCLSQGRVAFCNVVRLFDDWREVRPTVISAVPRIWNELHRVYLGKLEAALNRAIAGGEHTRQEEVTGSTPGDPIAVAKRCDELVLLEQRGVPLTVCSAQMLLRERRACQKEIDELLGGRVRTVVTGGAFTRPVVLKFLRGLRAMLYEGFGTTEVSSVGLVNSKRLHYGVDLRISPLDQWERPEGAPLDATVGEVCIKSPQMFDGYFNQPAATRDSFTKDGFYRTGDVGYLDRDGGLVLLGRAKMSFKNALGVFVAPEHIESRLWDAQLQLVEQLVVVGHFTTTTVVAIVVPRRDRLRERMLREIGGQHFQCECQAPAHEHCLDQLCQRAEAKQLVLDELQRAARAAKLAPHEQPAHVIMDSITDGWTAANGCLTHSLKPRRLAVLARHQTELDRLFSADAGDHGDDDCRRPSSTSGANWDSAMSPAFEQRWCSIVADVLPSVASADAGDTWWRERTFASLGGDSISAMSLVTLATSAFSLHNLPLSPFLDPEITMAALQELVMSRTRADPPTTDDGAAWLTEPFISDDDDVVDEQPSADIDCKEPGAVILTGATGFLGAHLLACLLCSSKQYPDQVVHCLVRGTDPRTKLVAACTRWGLGHATAEHWHRVVVHRADLSMPWLGLSVETRRALASVKNLRAIIHNGALVNHAAPLEHLKSVNVESTKYLLRIGRRAACQRFLFVSTAGASASAYTGYAISKFASERAVHQAAHWFPLGTVIVRPGALAGSLRGRGTCGRVSNPADFRNLLLQACEEVNAVFETGNRTIDWAPVDVTAESIAGWCSKKKRAGDETGVRTVVLGAEFPTPWALAVRQLSKSARATALPWDEWKQRVLAGEGRRRPICTRLKQVLGPESRLSDANRARSVPSDAAVSPKLCIMHLIPGKLKADALREHLLFAHQRTQEPQTT